MNSDFDIEKIITKSNELTVKVNGFFLHSKYDPKKEALQFVQKNYKANSLHILFGYGLGYFAEAFIDLLGINEELLVIDPLYDLLNSGIVPRVRVYRDIKEIGFNKILDEKIEKYNRRIHVIQSPNYDKLANVGYKAMLEFVTEQAKLNRINENTIKFFAEDWQKNYLFNLYNGIGDKSLIDLKEKFDLPIVVVSGGPSLTKQLPLLNEVKDQFLIIAAGSTINTLLSFNISPDFVVSIDGSLANYNHFKDIYSKHITYIYSFTSHFGIRESFEKNAFIFNTLGKEKMKEHFESISNLEIPNIAGGGSVANFAFTVAAYISSGPIAIIGQDLAYTNNRTHAENNKYYKIIDEEFKKERGMFLTEGYYNDEVLTDYVFLSMKKSFESLLVLIEKEREVYNCTEGGIHLEGFEKLPFKEFCQRNLKNEIVKKVIPNYQFKHNRTILLDKMKKELDVYRKIKNYLIDNLRVLKSNNSNKYFLENILKKLNKNDEKLKKLIGEVSMISILDPITINIQNNFLPFPNETAIDSFQRVFNQNKVLYSSLIEALDMTVGFTQELISKIEENEVEING
ncbi:6-hydroxymethylpterin diphosphokinase MptE-like protein [Psychrobacillus sp. FSL K6-2684]|uniref:motility associated factor glycosyltransferase family protein n=1 Tax=Psychrobacillus sp. FSL K6-2684 TaxID=2921547 RepID=UPI0030F763C2